MKIKKNDVAAFKNLVGNSFFSVTFTKKDGSERTLNGRLGVKKHLKGGELTYNPSDYNYVTVFDQKKGEYRTVNLNTVKELKVGGIVYKVEE